MLNHNVDDYFDSPDDAPREKILMGEVGPCAGIRIDIHKKNTWWRPDLSLHVEYSSSLGFFDGHVETFTFRRLTGSDWDPTLDQWDNLLIAADARGLDPSEDGVRELVPQWFSD
jgi:hypothetical protein